MKVYVVYSVHERTVSAAWTTDRYRAEEEYGRIRTYTDARTIGASARPSPLPFALKVLADKYPGHTVEARGI